MTATTTTNNRALLVARGVSFILIGLIWFLGTSPYAAPAHTAWLLAALAVGAGGCALGFYGANDHTYSYNRWFLASGILDILFGASILFFAQGSYSRLLDVVAFWGTLFGVLQFCLAIYPFFGDLLPGQRRAGQVGLRLLLGVAGAALTFSLWASAAGGLVAVPAVLMIIIGVLLLRQELSSATPPQTTHAMREI